MIEGTLRTAVALLLLGALASCGRSDSSIASADSSVVLVAVASNFVGTLQKLEQEFEQRTSYDLQMAAGSTGKLYAQITAGAPYDLLLAADQERPALLVQSGLAETAFSYASGQLVLWSPAGGDALEKLTGGNFQRLAVANPQLAPYGRAAQQTLAALQASAAADSFLHNFNFPFNFPFNKNSQRTVRVVQGENIGQTHTMIATGNADLGFTALSYVRAMPKQKAGSWWAVPSELHEPIVQDAVLLQRATDNPAAAAFVDFLQSTAACELIVRAGYQPPTTDSVAPCSP